MALPIILIAAFAATLTSGHICLLDPPQRGAVSVAKPADPSCYRRTPNCGGIPSGQPTKTFTTRGQSQISFQQNLNHWSQDRPGYLDIAVSYDMEASWETLKQFGDYPANDMVTQTNFSVSVEFRQPAASAVLRVRYVSQNPFEIDPPNNTDAIFYNCADIAIQEHEGTQPVLETLENSLPPPLHFNPNFTCRTPPRWVADGQSLSYWGEETTHKIYWDETQAMVRWDRFDKYRGFNFSFVTNYTLTSEGTLEFGIDYEAQSCTAYGSDKFYPWQYGPQSNMVWTKNITFHDHMETIWMNWYNGLTWQASVDPVSKTCLPMVIKSENLETTFQASVVNEPFQPDVFDVPSFCKASKTFQKKQCRGDKLV